jgi:hypothetical protein
MSYGILTRGKGSPTHGPRLPTGTTTNIHPRIRALPPLPWIPSTIPSFLHHAVGGGVDQHPLPGSGHPRSCEASSACSLRPTHHCYSIETHCTNIDRHCFSLRGRRETFPQLLCSSSGRESGSACGDGLSFRGISQGSNEEPVSGG